MRKILFVILIISCSMVYGVTQNEIKKIIELKGSLEHFQALQIKDPYEFYGSRTRFEFNTWASYESAFMFASLQGIYNSVIPSRTGVELREGYLLYESDKWDFKVGRQQIIWGKSDGIIITDVLSPRDYSEFMTLNMDEQRLGIDAIKFSLIFERSSFEFIYIPVFRGAQLPPPNTPWFPGMPSAVQGILDKAIENGVLSEDEQNMINYNNLTSYPQMKLQNGEIGFRALFFTDSFDFSISAGALYDKYPVLKDKFSFPIDPGMMTGGDITASDIGVLKILEHRRYGFFGGTFSMPLSYVVLRSEAALYVFKDLMTSFTQDDLKNRIQVSDDNKYLSYDGRGKTTEEGNILKYLIGVDFSYDYGITLSAQFAHDFVFIEQAAADKIARDIHDITVTFLASKTFFRDTLKLSENFSYSSGGNAIYNRFTVDYSLTNGFNLILGLDIFTALGDNNGDAGTEIGLNEIIGRYDDKDIVWFKAKYSF